MAKVYYLHEASTTLEPRQLVTTILEAAKYISKPMFGLKKVKLNLPRCFDEKLAPLNKWFFEIEQYCQIVGAEKEHWYGQNNHILSEKGCTYMVEVTGPEGHWLCTWAPSVEQLQIGNRGCLLWYRQGTQIIPLPCWFASDNNCGCLYKRLLPYCNWVRWLGSWWSSLVVYKCWRA